MYIQTSNGLGLLTASNQHESSLKAGGEYALGNGTPPSRPITVAGLAGSLTNLVFWERHPGLKGQTLKPNTKEAAEWIKLLKDEVKPALFNSSTEWRISQLVFFSRHPEILGHFKEQPKDRQQQLSREFDDIRKNIVGPWLVLRIARGKINSRTIYVVDNDAFRSLPWETRTRAGNEIARQYAFVNGKAPITVIFLDPGRFPEEFNFSDAVVSLTDPSTPPHVHVYWTLRQQVNNLNRAITALGSRQRLTTLDRTSFNPERMGIARVGKSVTPAALGTQVAVPLMASAVNLTELIDFLNKEIVPSGKEINPKDKSNWDDGQKELVGIALGRAMAHEVRHLFVGGGHAVDGLGSDSARMFGTNQDTFSAADRASIQSHIAQLESQQGQRPVAASYAAAERSLDFPF